MEILDIKAISDIVHQYNPQIQVIVDNTFSTPIITKPLIFDADIGMATLFRTIFW
ncbi:PLP-dependent transferase [Spiroplasma endosymbiont of Dactylopius coccus]